MRLRKRGFSEAFGRFVQRRRAAAGETQLRYAARLGISSSYLAEIERGIVPTESRVRAMANSAREDAAEWLAAGGHAEPRSHDSLITVSDIPTPYHGQRDDFPVLGSIGDHGIVSYGPDAEDQLAKQGGGERLDQKGSRVYRLLVDSPSVGGALDAGDEVVIDPDATPRRNARVIVRETDGTCRLVRYISASRQSAQVLRVAPLDAAPGLVKPVQLEGTVIGVLVRWTSKNF